MRILLVNYEYPPLGGGGGIAMMELARELSRRHEVHVLTSGRDDLPGVFKEESCDLTIHRVHVPGRTDRATASFASMAGFVVAGIRAGNELVRSLRVDVINTWFAIPSGIVGGAIAKKQNIPHVLTIIGGDIYDPSKWYSPHRFFPSALGVSWALRRADQFIAISSDIAARAKQHFSIQESIEVIPLGIHTPKFSRVSRQEIGLHDGKKYVVAVGRLVRRKDYPSLLRAVGLIDDNDVELLILGDGPEAGNLKALAAELGIQDRVHLLGFVEEELKYQILENSNVFALISLHEGFGVVYLEAMHCGLPVVAASEGGQADILEEGSNGRLVEIGNAESIASALRAYLEDPDLAKRTGEQNRVRFQHFSIENMAVRYEEELSGVL